MPPQGVAPLVLLYTLCFTTSWSSIRGRAPPNTFLVFSNAEVRLALLRGVLLAFGGDEDPENNREKAPWLHAGLRGNSIRAYES